MITLNLRERSAPLQLPAAKAQPITVPPFIVKAWSRRHADGSVGSVAAWSDGRYSGGDSASITGGDDGPERPTYRTLAEAFSGVDDQSMRRGHACSLTCGLWQEVPASQEPSTPP